MPEQPNDVPGTWDNDGGAQPTSHRSTVRDMNDTMTIEEIRIGAGWDEHALRNYFERFLIERNLLHDFAQYLMGVQAFIETYTPKEKS